MKKMNGIKKIALGTALSGALIVGAGFGTYSWFTSSATVSGSIENALLEISAEQSMTFTVENEGFQYLAPGRTTVSEFTISNDHENSQYEDVKIRAFLSLEGTTLNKFPNNGKGQTGETLAQLLSYYTFTFNSEDLEVNNVVIPGAQLVNAAGELLSVQIFVDKDLGEGDEAEVSVSVSLATDAENNLQGAVVTPKITVDAKQVDEGAEY